MHLNLNINKLIAHLKDKVKIAVKVPLERDGLERAKPFVSRICK